MSWVNIDGAIRYFLEDIRLRFGAKLQEGWNDFRKMAASLCYVYTEIISQICWL